MKRVQIAILHCAKHSELLDKLLPMLQDQQYHHVVVLGAQLQPLSTLHAMLPESYRLRCTIRECNINSSLSVRVTGLWLQEKFGYDFSLMLVADEQDQLLRQTAQEFVSYSQ